MRILKSEADSVALSLSSLLNILYSNVSFSCVGIVGHLATSVHYHYFQYLGHLVHMGFCAHGV